MWRLEIGNKMPIKGSRLVFKKCPELGFRVCRKGKGHTHTDADTEREKTYDRFTVWSCGSDIFSITGRSSIGISSTIIINNNRYKLPSPQFVSHLLLPGPNPPRSIFNSIEDPHYSSTAPKARHLGNPKMQDLG
jgi:hypothetical protein